MSNPLQGTRQRSPAAAPLPRGPGMILAAEHALLLRQVASQVDDLLQQAAAGRWPTVELQALISSLETAVPRQARQRRDETTARGPAADSSQCHRSHARLRDGIALLAATAADHSTRSASQLAVLARDLLCQLERYFAAAESLPGPVFRTPASSRSRGTRIR